MLRATWDFIIQALDAPGNRRFLHSDGGCAGPLSIPSFSPRCARLTWDSFIQARDAMANLGFPHSARECPRQQGIPSSTPRCDRHPGIPSFRPGMPSATIDSLIQMGVLRAALGFLHPHQGAIGHCPFHHSARGCDR
jgi:hypothetical protein